MCTDLKDNVNTEEVAGGKRVVIQNVSRPEGCNTTLACLTSVLQAAGEDINYSYLMGISARAFRLQFCWCPSAPNSHCGFNTLETALKATGYVGQYYPVMSYQGPPSDIKDVSAEEKVQARAGVEKSIDSGMCCICSSEEDTVLIGYEPCSPENETGWLRRPGPLPPNDENLPYAINVEKLPWGLVLVRKADIPAPSRTESILWSLRTAVKNAKTEMLGPYSMGFAAWDRWIHELQDVTGQIQKTKELLAEKGRQDEDPAFGIQLGNAWCYESLLDARKAAADYLRMIVPELDEKCRVPLEAAANEYEALAAALVGNADCFTTLAPYPWMQDKPWTTERQLQQVENMRKALVYEEKAFAGLEEMLKRIS